MKNTQSDVDYSRPRRRICEGDVEIPTLIIEPFFKGGEPEVFVQWFANLSPTNPLNHEFWDALARKFQRMQFRFPIRAPRNDRCWMGHPELFKVVMLGQVRDWPNKVAIPRMGKDDDWILWVISSHYGRKTQSGEGPASFLMSLDVMLKYPIGGTITPKKYYDATVIDREREAFERQGRRWSLRGLNA